MPNIGLGKQMVQGHDIHIRAAQSLTFTKQSFIMGFADLSIAEIAADYNLPVEEVLVLCDRLGIAYKNPQTRLALEDAKAIISEILSQIHPSSTDGD
jgi:hypothetical protein